MRWSNSFIFIKIKILIIFLIIIFFSCSNKEITVSSTTDEEYEKTPKVEQQISKLKKITQEKYKYRGLAFRDPFIPVSGEKIAKAKLELKREVISPPLGSLKLRAFIVDEIDKIALFTSPFGSYLLVNGKLYDRNNRLVKDISGNIIYDKNKMPKGVILISSDNNFKEYIIGEN